MRGKNLIQLLKTIDLISRPQGATKKQLSKELNVGIRTVSRLIDIMHELGFPVFDHKEPLEKEKNWKFEESYFLKLPNIKIPDISLSFSEITSLYLLKGESTIFTGTEIDKQLNAAFLKFNLFMPKETRTHLKKLKQVFICRTESAKNYSGKEDFVNTIIESIINQTSCKLKYHSYNVDQTKEYELLPLHLFENKGGLYFFAFDLKPEKIKTFAVERICRISMTDNHMDYPENFSPHQQLNSAFDMIFDDPLKVKVWFSKNIARYICERQWAVNQKITEKNDGSILFEMTTSGWRDVKRWVMSYGIEAKLIEPKKMKEEIENEIREMAGEFVG